MKDWYDKIAWLYDFFTAWFYRKMRRELIENLHIQTGNHILIIACGTGQSFELIVNKTGSKGKIIAIDNSSEMLKQARKKIRKNHWNNIRLVQMDVRELNPDLLKEWEIEKGFNCVIGELAFSVIPEWKKVMQTSVNMLEKNGKLGLLDWYRPQNDWLTKIVNFLAKSDINRNTPEYARQLTQNFRIIKKYFFKSVYIAVGNKKQNSARFSLVEVIIKINRQSEIVSR